MHEDTQRRLIRTAFLVLCVVPTIIVMGYTLYRALPVAQQRLQRQLSHDLGIDVRFTNMETPRPNQLRLTDVQLIDHETQSLLVTLPRVDAAHTDKGWLVRFNEAIVESDSLHTLWDCLRHRIMPQELFTKQVADIAGKKLSLHLGDQTFDAHHFVWASLSEGDDHKSIIEFYPEPTEDRKQTPPLQLLLERDRSEQPIKTRLVFETGPHEVPLGLLTQVSDWQPPAAGKFRGNIKVDEVREQWQTRATGRLVGIRLQDASPNWIPDAVAGNVTLDLEEARLDASGLTRANGKLHIEALDIPRPLLENLIKARLLTPDKTFTQALPKLTRDARYTIPQLDVELTISNGGITATGCQVFKDSIASQTPDGVLRSHETVSVRHLVSVFVPSEANNAYELANRWQQLLPPTVPFRRR